MKTKPRIIENSFEWDVPQRSVPPCEKVINLFTPTHYNEPITLPIPAKCEMSKESREKEQRQREYIKATKDHYEGNGSRDLVEIRRREYIKAAEEYAAKFGIRPSQELYAPPIFADEMGVATGTDTLGVFVAGIACFLGIAGLLAGVVVAIAESI